jgi:hypothetical protein
MIFEGRNSLTEQKGCAVKSLYYATLNWVFVNITSKLVACLMPGQYVFFWKKQKIGSWSKNMAICFVFLLCTDESDIFLG